MKVHLQYGQDGIEAEIPSDHVTVVTPRFVPGLPDEAAAFRDAVRQPDRYPSASRAGAAPPTAWPW